MATTDDRGGRRGWFTRALVLGGAMLALSALLTACGDEATLPTLQPAMALAVDSVSPRASEAGETLELRIVGAGFRSDDVATIERDGAAAANVVVDGTTFVSETELLATVSIGADAVPALYDVVVSNADGVRAAAGGIFTVEEPLPIVVAEAQPREAGQGETREVRIFGSGFRQGDEAVWERDGEAYDGVVIQSTEFVSADELIVTISVDPEAVVASYDVAVSRPRKRGIGTEVFDILPGIGSELEAMFQFTYDGYRSDSFHVDHTFVLDPATMDPGSWGLTYYVYEYAEQALIAHYLRDDGLLDMMWCWVPGGRVREPGTRPLECWFTPQYNPETGEYADPEDYTSWVEGDRPGDGSGTVTFTSVTPDRLEGTFSITMHVVNWEDWVGSPSIEIKDGEFDLPVVSSYWYQGDDDGEGGEPNPPPFEAPSGSRAYAINDHGEIAGVIGDGGSGHHAARWVVSPKGTVTGPEVLGTIEGYPHLRPRAINNEGQIVGWAQEHPHAFRSIGFIYDGTVRPLTPLYPDAPRTSPTRINAQGVVVGILSVSLSEPTSGQIWLNPLDPDERPVKLPSPSTLLNNHGVVAFTIIGVSNSMSSFRAQVLADGTLSDLEPIDLSSVTGMNDALDFVGRRGVEYPDLITVLLRDSTHIPLRALPGDDYTYAIEMNNPLPGQPLRVIGWSQPFGGPGTPVFWNVSTSGVVSGPFTLPAPDGYAASDVWDVNSHGWMVGMVHPIGNRSETTATVWLPRETILLGGLDQPISDPAVRAGKRRCLSRPGGPDRCRWGSTGGADAVWRGSSGQATFAQTLSGLSVP